MKLKHLTKIKDLYRFTIYENSKEEYYTFCTSECASMIDTYILNRRKVGEDITKESYLIRNEFNRLNHILKKQITKPRKLTNDGIHTLFNNMLIKIGLKEVTKGKYQRQSKLYFMLSENALTQH